ncbi:MAG TPA: alpha/beta fold hydrolase [Acidimicrobiia bacterium]|nr:alpha/beta fold hydrolase [Acidimicrobiia bacterium]
MSATRSALKALGVTAAVAGATAASGYVAERATVRSLRRRPDPDAGHLGALAFDTTRRVPTFDGGSLATMARGHGSPIVFSHGVTIDSRVWVKQFAELPERGVRAIAFDHRGHGDSIVGTTGHSIESLAADMRSVLETLDVRDALLVGHSMGGVAVQAFALRHPDVLRERVRGIVLLSTLGKTSTSSSRRLQSVAARVTGAVDFRPLMTRPDLGMVLARVGFGRQPTASQVELNRQMLAACPVETVRDATAALLGLDLLAELPSLDVPTLVIGGTADVITPPRESRRLAALIPDAHLEMFQGAGHMIMLERTEAFHDLLLDFARDVGTLPATAGAA